MSKVTPELLDDCLCELQSGRATVADCLTTDSDAAEELRGLLEVACAIERPAPVVPSSAFRARGRAALLQVISTDIAPARTSVWQRLWGVVPAGWARPSRLSPGLMGMRPALIIAVVILLLAVSGSGVIYAAQDALPDDPLYQVKTSMEGLQVTLAADDETKAQAHLDLAAKRVSELQRASEIGRPAAASAAADAFIQELDQIDEHVAQAASSGKDTSGLVVQLADTLARQQAELASAQEQAPASARPSLDRANRAAEQGLIIISASLQNNPSAFGERGKGDDQTAAPTSTVAAGSTTATATVGQATATVTTGVPVLISGTLPLSFTQAISDVEGLVTDPDVRGNSERGLIAKLEAAQKAIEKGHTDTALNILNAFLNELNAFQGSGHISADNYAKLFADYSALVAGLGGTPQAQAAPKTNKEESSGAGEERGSEKSPKIKEGPSGAGEREDSQKDKDAPGRSGDENGGSKDKQAPGQQGREGDAPKANGVPGQQGDAGEAPGRVNDADEAPKVKDKEDSETGGRSGRADEVQKDDTKKGGSGPSQREQKEPPGRGRR